MLFPEFGREDTWRGAEGGASRITLRHVPASLDATLSLPLKEQSMR
jgi:hypothetical protein